MLTEIDADFRAPLVLYYMEDFSYKEIADVLAVPLGTVQSRIARAKVQLLRRLTEMDRLHTQTKRLRSRPKKSCCCIVGQSTPATPNSVTPQRTRTAIQSVRSDYES